MTYTNAESYEGDFVEGERQGVGTYRSSQGKVLFEGRWQKDQFAAPF